MATFSTTSSHLSSCSLLVLLLLLLFDSYLAVLAAAAAAADAFLVGSRWSIAEVVLLVGIATRFGVVLLRSVKRHFSRRQPSGAGAADVSLILSLISSLSFTITVVAALVGAFVASTADSLFIAARPHFDWGHLVLPTYLSYDNHTDDNKIHPTPTQAHRR